MPKVKPQLTEEEQVKAIASVYSNVSKLRMANFMYTHSPASPTQISEATKIIYSVTSRTLSEMLDAGVVEKTDYKEPGTRQIFYRLTDLGKRIVTMFN